MPKRKTAHTAKRLAKKQTESDRKFFSDRIPVMAHPFGNKSMADLIRILFGMELTDLMVPPRDESEEGTWFAYAREAPRLFNRPWHVLDFEEILLLDNLLTDVSKNTAFEVSWQRRELLRTLNPKRLFEHLEKYGGFLGLDPEDVGRRIGGMKTPARRREVFSFPEDCDWAIGSIMCSAILYWQWRRRQEWKKPKGESEFIWFLVDLFRLIAYRPKQIKVSDKGKTGTYVYEFDEAAALKFKGEFKLSILIMPWRKQEWRVIDPVHWSVSIIALQKLLSDRKNRGVTLVTKTRPMEHFAKSLKNYCESRGIRFSKKHVPYDVVEVDTKGWCIFLIEEWLSDGLRRYSCFPGSIILPITWIKESGRYL